MFTLTSEDNHSFARTGRVRTKHGSFETPLYIPVATQATLKSLGVDDLNNLGVPALLANTYHLMLRPGDQLIKKMGGLHKFMSWDKPLVTDSGGYQVFSLGLGMEHQIGKMGIKHDQNSKPENWTRIDDKGVTFRSHLTGEAIRMTPECSMKVQENLGADIIMAFDECSSPLSDHAYTKKAVLRTHAWAKQCLKTHTRKDQELFGIIQGGGFKDLRIASSKFISKLNFDGYAIGGSFGEFKQDLEKALNWIVPIINKGYHKEKARHLLGVGSVEDLFLCVELGMDMFDCVGPTRMARRGHLLVTPPFGNRKNKFRINIEKAIFKQDKKPIDKECECFTCQNHSKAYLRHLFVAKELLYHRLATIHNVHYMLRLMESVRTSLQEGRFRKLKKEFLG